MGTALSSVSAALRRPVPLTRLAPWIALLVPLFVYDIGFRYLGSGDTVPAELLPISILNHQGFDFRAFVSGDLPYWFRLVHGRVVSQYPVLPGILNLPIYASARLLHVDLYAHRFFLSMLTASFIAALSVVFLYLALTHVCRSEKEALFFSAAYAFGTTVWSVASRGLFQHAPSVLFLSIALWALLRGGETVPLAGLALGLAVINRPPNLAIALPLAVYVVRYERRRVLPFAALALVPALLHAWYASTYWGSPFSLAQGVRGDNFGGRFWIGLAGILFSPSRGLFVFSPTFLFAFPAAAATLHSGPRGSERLPRYLVVATVAMLLVYSFWSMWWGGHSFGYRLITEVAPLLTILIAGYWPTIAKSRIAVAAFALCLAFSIYVHFLGAMIYPTDFDRNVDLQPRRLWDLHGSELELATRKLVHTVAPASRLAPAIAPSSAAPEPATAWWRPELDNESIPGWIEAPLDGAEIAGPLEISGWAKSIEGEVGIRVAIAPEGFVLPVERHPRPDVCRALPQLGDCSRAGWRAVVSRPATGTSEHMLLIEMRAPNGSVRRLGPVRFRWKPR